MKTSHLTLLTLSYICRIFLVLTNSCTLYNEHYLTFPLAGLFWSILAMSVSVVIAGLITYNYKLGPAGYAR